MALPRGATLLTLPPVGPRDDAGRLWCGFELAADTAAPGDARRRVRAQLRRWAFPADLCDTAQVLVSELVTNAVVHTGSSLVGCLLRAGDGRLRIEVHDQGGARSVPMPCWATEDDENGRGLLLVDTLSEEWGVDRADAGDGRVVWLELGAPAD